MHGIYTGLKSTRLKSNEKNNYKTMSAIEIVGIIGGFISCSAIIPQIYKSYKHRATKDLSWSMFGIFYVGAILNIVFGFVINHPAVYLTALYSLSTNTVLASMKWYFEKYAPAADTIHQNDFPLLHIHNHGQSPSNQTDDPMSVR